MRHPLPPLPQRASISSSPTISALLAGSLPFLASPDQALALEVIPAKLMQDSGGITQAVMKGYAGSGKTTVAYHILKKVKGIREIIAVGMTGKATSRIRDSLRGEYPTSTLHKFMYGSPVTMGACPGCGAWHEDFGGYHADLYGVSLTCRNCDSLVLLLRPGEKTPTISGPLYAYGFSTKLEFKPNEALERGEPIILVVDEASMLSIKVYKELMEILPGGSAVFFILDPSQIPPVRGEGMSAEDAKSALVDVKADAVLTTIHRQQSDAPHLYVAKSIRLGKYKRYPLNFPAQPPGWQYHDRIHIEHIAQWAAAMRKADQDFTLLTYTNKRRYALNRAVRRHLGLTEYPLPFAPGDRLLLRVNLHPLDMMNGEVFTVEESAAHAPLVLNKYSQQALLRVRLKERPGEDFYLYRELIKEDYDAQAKREFRRLRNKQEARRDFLESQWNDVDAKRYKGTYGEYLLQHGMVPPEKMLFGEHGECITFHVSQGSEWDHIGIVWDSSCWGWNSRNPEECKRAMYTGVTRGVKSVTALIL